jgi:methylglutaconyl-CoA hydratase
VSDMARELARETSASALALTKRLLADIPGYGLREALDLAVRTNAGARATADCRAGVTSFLDRKDPPWKRDFDAS